MDVGTFILVGNITKQNTTISKEFANSDHYWPCLSSTESKCPIKILKKILNKVFSTNKMLKVELDFFWFYLYFDINFKISSQTI